MGFRSKINNQDQRLMRHCGEWMMIGSCWWYKVFSCILTFFCIDCEKVVGHVTQDKIGLSLRIWIACNTHTAYILYIIYELNAEVAYYILLRAIWRNFIFTKPFLITWQKRNIGLSKILAYYCYFPLWISISYAIFPHLF